MQFGNFSTKVGYNVGLTDCNRWCQWLGVTVSLNFTTDQPLLSRVTMVFGSGAVFRRTPYMCTVYTFCLFTCARVRGNCDRMIVKLKLHNSLATSAVEGD